MLHIHRAERADGLVEALADLLADPPHDPFAPEIVSVATRGMERWITQQLSSRLGTSGGRGRQDGVAANILFPFPRRLVNEAVAAGSGIDAEADPWLPERSAWPLLEVVDESVDELWLHEVAPYLGGTSGEPARAARFANVRHLADLFDRYALYRPEMTRAWREGHDTDAGGQPLPRDYGWQPELWRRLRERIALPDPEERLGAACDRLIAEPALVALPQRLSLFGLTHIPGGYMKVLRALSSSRDVHLFLLHPSPALWESVAGLLERGPSTRRRADDPTATAARNPLLASWGHDAREMQLTVTAGAGHTDDHVAVEVPVASLLSRIQADVRADRPPPGPPLPGEPDARPALAHDDRSVQVHACHGRARQVEVVRDAILHVLAEDDTLEPRDVLVMCPDIETFAPLIQASFGVAGAPGDDEVGAVPPADLPPDLRVRLADRSLRQTNPILGVVGRLLELVDQRVTASQVLDLLDREPVRRRFALDDADIGRIEEWVAASGIRWGLDAEHRRPFKLEAVAAGTWRAGLDSVLLGVAMPGDGRTLFGGALPLDGVDSGAIELAGRFGELIDRLEAALRSLTGPHTIDSWADAIAAAADALTEPAPREGWQRAELGRLLGGVVADATHGDAASGCALELQELRALLGERLAGRPTRANFRTGHLTVCTLVPMRSVPHRVVCLLGLDDGAFPRKAPRDGDDLMLHDPHVGDRDGRREDRQLLLDALMAARDRLIVTYTGNDERTNAPRPPAVPVGELLDVVDRTVRAPEGEAGAAATSRVWVRHPLQPFDARNFTRGALGPPGPWSFDSVMLDGARAMAGERGEPRPFLEGPIDCPRPRAVEVERLVQFVQHPVRAFLRERLGLALRGQRDELEDALPVELEPLEQYQLGERLLRGLLEGASFGDAIAVEQARGSLPPGRLALPVIAALRPVVEAIAAAAASEVDSTADRGAVDLRVALAEGRALSGTVDGVCGDLLATFTYARLRARQRIAAWVRLLALTAAFPERPFAAISIGRAEPDSGQTLLTARIPPLPGDARERRALATEQLEILVDLYARGMRENLPIACRSSAAYAQAAAGRGDPLRAGAAQWESSWNVPGEDSDPEHELVYGRGLSFAELLAESPRADESGPGWDAGDGTRFGRHARRLWAGPLAHEVLTRR